MDQKTCSKLWLVCMYKKRNYKIRKRFIFLICLTINDSKIKFWSDFSHCLNVLVIQKIFSIFHNNELWSTRTFMESTVGSARLLIISFLKILKQQSEIVEVFPLVICSRSIWFFEHLFERFFSHSPPFTLASSHPSLAFKHFVLAHF